MHLREGLDMPRGLNGQRRPSDANRLAHKVTQNAT